MHYTGLLHMQLMISIELLLNSFSWYSFLLFLYVQILCMIVCNICFLLYFYLHVLFLIFLLHVWCFFFFHCLCTNKKYYRAQIVCDSSGCMFKRVAQMLNSIFLHYPILVSIELICIVNIYRWLFVLAAPDWSHSQESPGHKSPHNLPYTSYISLLVSIS